jgi:hypothetical protein
MKLSKLVLFVTLAALGTMALAAAQAPTSEERVAALKANLATSQTLLKQYEWIEVTVLSLKGEEKSRTEFRCYWGADGKVQKVPVGATPSTDKKRGLRGKIVEKKKGELSEYMDNAVELVKSYVPPDPARIQASKDAGKMSLTPAGSRMRIDFHDYQKPGDTLSVELDMAKNTLLGLTVASWLKDAQDVIGLKAGFSSLNDGATYPAEITLSAPSQNLEVKMTNSGYKKM